MANGDGEGSFFAEDFDGRFLFTSESVGEGHPDKMCDQISDAVLDAHLRQDPDAKVACETVTKTGMVMILGEITSQVGSPGKVFIVIFLSSPRSITRRLSAILSSKSVTMRAARGWTTGRCQSWWLCSTSRQTLPGESGHRRTVMTPGLETRLVHSFSLQFIPKLV